MSNVIKSSHYVPIEQLKMPETVRKYRQAALQHEEQTQSTEPWDAERLLSEDEQLNELRSSILHDAQEFAETQVRQASEEAETMLEQAKEQVDAWWEEQRTADEERYEQIRQEAMQQGYEEGLSKAEESVQQSYEAKISEAGKLLEQSYRMREQIIQEAEPFLVELSCRIASKIVNQQFDANPDAVLEMVKKQLARKRENGTITLCVAPEHFNFMYAAREELNLSIDSQAELQIIPDASVRDYGCVIRSALGSIDARMDTQLSEIKKALLQIAHQHEEQSEHDK